MRFAAGAVVFLVALAARALPAAGQEEPFVPPEAQVNICPSEPSLESPLASMGGFLLVALPASLFAVLLLSWRDRERRHERARARLRFRSRGPCPPLE